MVDRSRAEGPAPSARRVDVGTLPGVLALPVAARSVVERQDGVATTGQLGGWGVTSTLVSRRVRSGQWRRLHRGVVVLQSGAPTWRQLARGALLAAGAGAALSHGSAGFVHGLLRHPGPTLVVSVPARRVVVHPGLDVRRRRTMPHTSGALRCVDLPETVLDLVEEATTEDDVVGLLCESVRLGVYPPLLVRRATARPAGRHRALVAALLGDPDTRVESPLELRYDRDVERAHGLPRSRAQVRALVGGAWIRSDRRFEEYALTVELDGRLAHAGDRLDADVWRDNAVRIERRDVTLRYRWHHVVAARCETAAQLATALRTAGWTGTPRRCGPACRLAPDRAGFVAPGIGDARRSA